MEILCHPRTYWRLSLPGWILTRSLGVTMPLEPPSNLDRRGADLWSDLVEHGDPAPAERVLIEEACRIVDRLEKLDRLLSGDAASWLDVIVTNGDDGVVALIINKPLGEARQQALALKQIFTELRQMRAADADPDAAGGDGADDELAARRAKRIADAAGR